MAETTFDNPDFETDESDITPGEAFDAGINTARKGGKKAKDAIETDIYIPLFPDADKNPTNVIHELQVFKLNGPDDGFKGAFAPSTTLLQLARLVGNGTFNIHACRADGKVLRRNINQKIDVPMTVTKAAPANSSAPIDLTLLRYQHETNEKSADRVLAMAQEASAQSREQSTSHVRMVQETANATVARDRDLFSGVMNNQQTFFSAMLTQQAQQHAQQMEILRENARQEQIRSEQAHERAMRMSDPSTLISLFQQGLQTGQGMSGENNDPITVIGNTVTEGLRQVGGMMRLKALTSRPNPRSLAAKGAQTGTKPANRTAPVQAPPKLAPEIPPIEKLQRLQALAEQKGLTIPDLLDDLVLQMEEMPDAEFEEEEIEDESAEDSSSGEATPS